MTSRRRGQWTGRVLLAVLAVLLGLLGALRPQAAWAADDQVTSWKINYTVNPDGTVDATETLVYRLGATSGRHGIQRFFTIREPMGDKDAVYRVSKISVTSPDAPSTFTTMVDDQGRDQFLVVRIGDKDRTIRSTTATYTISYRVEGAMRHFDGYDEFYWDALGDKTPLVTNIEVTASVPGGVQQVSCSMAEAGQQAPCTTSVLEEGRGKWQQSSKPADKILTIGAKIKPGMVSPNTPILETRADLVGEYLRKAAMGAGLASLVLSPLVGLVRVRRHGRDYRFEGLPPGVLPAPGQPVRQKLSEDIEVPVSFSPPQTSVAEGGLLADGVIDTVETTATLVDLAVRGAVRLDNTGGMTVHMVNPALASAPHEQVLLSRLFGSLEPGRSVDVGSRGSMLGAHEALVQSVRNQVAQKRWFTDMPGARAQGCGFLLAGTSFFMIGAFAFHWMWWLMLPALPMILTHWWVSSKLARGQRTAAGRALTDQVEGFRTYIATAEADQLRFEEGEDIFSRYLPWAIVFGLAERWADVCAELVRRGLLSAAAPQWYVGSNWNFYAWNDSVATLDNASRPYVAPSPSVGGTSGSGWGGGSSFGGGGGFSGGGGGGGGVGSW